VGVTAGSREEPRRKGLWQEKTNDDDDDDDDDDLLT
jgi:hypothetical protein